MGQADDFAKAHLELSEDSNFSTREVSLRKWVMVEDYDGVWFCEMKQDGVKPWVGDSRMVVVSNTAPLSIPPVAALCPNLQGVINCDSVFSSCHHVAGSNKEMLVMTSTEQVDVIEIHHSRKWWTPALTVRPGRKTVIKWESQTWCHKGSRRR
ncbi:hypothetical protein RIF29_26968 [Crotalaria pallida]|uniref:Uncharacterized protein n=1 Tax=Crotalaria pallida TaxID=3830 RepID=A0AAN9EVJ1_CROPI